MNCKCSSRISKDSQAVTTRFLADRSSPSLEGSLLAAPAASPRPTTTASNSNPRKPVALDTSPMLRAQVPIDTRWVRDTAAHDRALTPIKTAWYPIWLLPRCRAACAHHRYARVPRAAGEYMIRRDILLHSVELYRQAKPSKAGTGFGL
jgi:hypothetical protein